ncbi:ATP/GTP-binding protein [Sediminibacterium sp.]|uniref:AAA family ATPase n=1 Tax=Sediminibacterium sp. TaxID=1917865 RepID=UPI002730D53B|nr:ATP-binding protein [Sediminibacterium sp.]MDP2420218.1 ATP-binding protein [Sediminibacterium sp.]
MLLEFTIGNFLSIKDKKTLSLEATSIKEHLGTNVVKLDRFQLLRGAVIYGANAGGKSNFIKAMSTMRRIVKQSFDASSTDELGITPFLLSTDTSNKPSFFEILFLIGTVRYRYGFEVDNTSVKSEWLFESKIKSEKPLFIREGDGIDVSQSFKEAKDLEEKTRENALFLSVLDQFNGTTAKSIMKWFSNFITISGLSHERYKNVTFKMLEDENLKPQLLDFYKRLDLGFDEIDVEKKPFEAKDFTKLFNEEFAKQFLSDIEGKSKIDIKTIHKKYNNDNEVVGFEKFDMRRQESSGTNKVFNISGPVFDVLKNGGVLIIDELDASLHPLITLTITKLFNSSEFNKTNAQLIFATHDTNLFEYGHYRRDQIYFVEKDVYGASDLYSLVEYKEDGGKKVRKDRSFEKDYIQGRYGAIPYIGNLHKLIN